jgi:hypothetical protein
MDNNETLLDNRRCVEGREKGCFVLGGVGRKKKLLVASTERKRLQIQGDKDHSGARQLEG